MINKKDIIKSFNNASESYDDAAFFQKEIATRLFDRLQLIRIAPKYILDLGAGTGFSTRFLEQHYRSAKIIGLDFAEQMLLKAKKHKRWFDRKTFICADADLLPFANDSFDLVFSNLMLQWSQDSEHTMAEIHRVLKPNGLLLFSSLGRDTLFELRETWAKIDTEIHVHSFHDMHFLGDILQQLKFKDAVVDMEFVTVTYNDLRKILLDLKNIGAHNVAKDRSKGLTGKQKFERFAMLYEKLRNAEGLLPLTYEVIYGHAWGTEKKTLVKKEIEIPLSTIKKR